jgi:hypothetical protein
VLVTCDGCKESVDSSVVTSVTIQRPAVLVNTVMYGRFDPRSVRVLHFCGPCGDAFTAGYYEWLASMAGG